MVYEIIFTYMIYEQCLCVLSISDVEGAVSWIGALESLGASRRPGATEGWADRDINYGAVDRMPVIMISLWNRCSLGLLTARVRVH